MVVLSFSRIMKTKWKASNDSISRASRHDGLIFGVLVLGDLHDTPALPVPLFYTFCFQVFFNGVASVTKAIGGNGRIPQ